MYRKAAEEKFFPEIANADNNVRRNFWFTGKVPEIREYNPFVSATVNVLNHAIWELKLKKELVPISIFIEDFIYTASKLTGNKYLRESKATSVPRRLFVTDLQ